MPAKSKSIMLDVKIVRPSDHPDWNTLLDAEAGFSIFHTAEWADILTRSYGYRPAYFVCRGEKGVESLLAVMEVKSRLTGIRGVSLPFTDACEPVTADAQTFQKLWDQAVSLGRKRKWKYLEIRGGQNHLADKPSSAVHIGHRLDLARGTDAIYAGLRDSTRRNIKKARSEKVEVNIANTLPAMEDFCRLNAMTRKEHGLPPQPHRFFQQLYDRVISRDMGFIARASVANTIVAANVYLHFGREVVYKYGASDKQFQHLRANNLVMWESIKWSCDRGFQSLNFGRTEPEHKGLLQFKAGWGANPYQIFYYRYDLKKNSFIADLPGVHPLAKKVFNKLPSPVLKTLGGILYRHMG